MKRRPKIAIIGGGIAGLTAALALFRRGVEAAVYEQTGALSEIGAGVQMTPERDEGAVCPWPRRSGDAIISPMPAPARSACRSSL